jgi:hypothetical protein
MDSVLLRTCDLVDPITRILFVRKHPHDEQNLQAILTDFPLESNYKLKQGWCCEKTVTRVARVSQYFHGTGTQLKDHLRIVNLSHECLIRISAADFHILKQLFAAY